MAQPTRMMCLIISDVPGDNPADVASGPTVNDDSTPPDALRVLQRYGIQTPEPVNKLLSQPAGPVESAANSEVKLIATPQMALQAAARAVCRHGLAPLILGDAIEGESREVATVMARIVQSVKQYGHPVCGPAVLLSGGETTVTVHNDQHGKGGGVIQNTRSVWPVHCRGKAAYEQSLATVMVSTAQKMQQVLWYFRTRHDAVKFEAWMRLIILMYTTVIAIFTRSMSW